MTYPENQWSDCDKDGSGQISFDEFSEWAIAKNLDLDDDDSSGQSEPEVESEEQVDPELQYQQVLNLLAKEQDEPKAVLFIE